MKTFSQLSTNELFQIYRVRTQVFVVEQACPYQEVDEWDLLAVHIFAWDAFSQAVIAYGRIIIQPDHIRLGRIMVTPAYRGKGLGRTLLSTMIEEGQHLAMERPLVIQAQSYLQTFYESVGFAACSDHYLEDGISHIDMIFQLYHSSK